jgi:hypothetical protein
MSFSLRSTFVAVAWIAWLLAALTVQHGLVPELFVVSQFTMLAVAMSLALYSTVRLRLFGICFAAGFLLGSLCSLPKIGFAIRSYFATLRRDGASGK